MVKRWLGIIALSVTSISWLILCPHSKVEESFNLQATHDLYYHGIMPALRSSWNPLKNSSGKLFRLDHDNDTAGQCERDDEELLPYDHLRYPGVVPRSFAGPIVLASLLRILRPIVPSSPLLLQSLSRLILLLFHLHAHYRLAHAANSNFTSNRDTHTFHVGNYYLLITAVQFHLPYYSSRTLPNTFALLLQLHAYAHWLSSNIPSTCQYLVAAAAIFRCDGLILLFAIGLSLLLRTLLRPIPALFIGILTALLCFFVTVPLDSLLWQRWTWPEGEVLFFNTVQNRSGEWGVLPWHWYFTQALPKGLLVGVCLVIFGLLRLHALDTLDTATLKDIVDLQVALYYFLPALGYVALYSLLPHKEVRFVFAVFPIFNVIAAKGLAGLHHLLQNAFQSQTAAMHVEDAVDRSNTHSRPATISKPKTGSKPTSFQCVIRAVLYLAAVGGLAISLLASCTFVAISRHNYPGGDAITILQQHLKTVMLLQNDFDSKDELLDSPGPGPGQTKQNVEVYVDVASAMTGVSLFAQRHVLERGCGIVGSAGNAGDVGDVLANPHGSIRTCSFVKAGYEEENSAIDWSKDESNGSSSSLSYSRFSHLLSEKGDIQGFHVVGTARGYPKLDIKGKRIVTQDAIFVMERDGWRDS